MARLDPGIHNLPAEQYHLDPAEQPSMSASDAQTMLDSSARHVWTRHPRLNPLASEAFDVEQWDSGKRLRMEHGSALHAMILGKGRALLEIDAEDYRSKGAKEARASAVAENAIPILASHKPKLIACAMAAREQIEAHRDLRAILKAEGKAEQTMIWREPIGAGRGKHKGIFCRAMVDWLPADPSTPMVDFKFTTTSAAPESYARTVRESLGVRAAHYMRGGLKLRGRAPNAYLIAAVEMQEPYGLSVHRADTELLDEAEAQWKEAAARFAASLAMGTDRAYWPFWPAVTNLVSVPVWQQSAWHERKLTEAIPPQRGGLTVTRVRQLTQQLGGPVQ